MTAGGGNIFDSLPDATAHEKFTALLRTDSMTIERVVSHGQASPPGFWYDQARDEWILLLAGSAGLRFESESAARHLGRGDYVHIPAHMRHRVEWTDAHEATVWLAIHHG
jgi:cupin 2 domain-containing protein